MVVKRQIDWEAIERDYRTGMLSLSEIGARHGISKGRISQVAKRDQWDRDLSVRIQKKVESKLNDALLNDSLNAKRAISDRERVEAGAEAITSIVLAHRIDVQRSRRLVMSLLNELEEQTGNMDLYQQLGELMESPDEKGTDKLNELYRKVISLSGRTGTMKSLADSLKTLVGLERQAFGLKDGVDDQKKPMDESAIDDRLALLLAK